MAMFMRNNFFLFPKQSRRKEYKKFNDIDKLVRFVFTMYTQRGEIVCKNRVKYCSVRKDGKVLHARYGQRPIGLLFCILQLKSAARAPLTKTNTVVPQAPNQRFCRKCDCLKPISEFNLNPKLTRYLCAKCFWKLGLENKKKRFASVPYSKDGEKLRINLFYWFRHFRRSKIAVTNSQCIAICRRLKLSYHEWG